MLFSSHYWSIWFLVSLFNSSLKQFSFSCLHHIEQLSDFIQQNEEFSCFLIKAPSLSSRTTVWKSLENIDTCMLKWYLPSISCPWIDTREAFDRLFLKLIQYWIYLPFIIYFSNSLRIPQIAECVKNMGPMIPMELKFSKVYKIFYDINVTIVYEVIQNIIKRFLKTKHPKDKMPNCR